MNHPDLLDCPCCGDSATMTALDEQDERRYWLRVASCGDCGLQISGGIGWNEYCALGVAAASVRVGEIVAALWNKRPAADLCANAQLRADQESPDPMDDPRVKALVEAIKGADREYETEYAGRMYSICTGCDAQLSEDQPHRSSCAWTAIDAALAAMKGGGR